MKHGMVDRIFYVARWPMLAMGLTIATLAPYLIWSQGGTRGAMWIGIHVAAFFIGLKYIALFIASCLVRDDE